jgi:hypothetical protein
VGGGLGGLGGEETESVGDEWKEESVNNGDGWRDTVQTHMFDLYRRVVCSINIVHCYAVLERTFGIEAIRISLIRSETS